MIAENDGRTRIGIAREVPSPLYKRAALQIAASDTVAANGAQDGRIGELWL